MFEVKNTARDDEFNCLNKNSSFHKTMESNSINIERTTIRILQVNLGKLCNQACLHCHVEAGPKRTEIMSKQTMLQILEVIKGHSDIQTVDLTGGAPEMNPDFRFFVSELKKLKKSVIDRCNLTVLFETNQEDTAEFLALNKVQIVASLPCYSKSNVEKQRGRGVFDKSIIALKKLNALGYGKQNSDLKLDLVYNPVGTSLPPSQEKLELDYKRELKELFDIDFNKLYTITNMPIKRFLYDLERQNKLEEYMQLLSNSFNPVAAENIMCKSLVSVSWDGFIYDCDFNQMLDIPIGWKKTHISQLTENKLNLSKIAFKDHCYGCTAGAGSSCSGSLT